MQTDVTCVKLWEQPGPPSCLRWHKHLQASNCMTWTCTWTLCLCLTQSHTLPPSPLFQLHAGVPLGAISADCAQWSSQWSSGTMAEGERGERRSSVVTRGGLPLCDLDIQHNTFTSMTRCFPKLKSQFQMISFLSYFFSSLCSFADRHFLFPFFCLVFSAQNIDSTLKGFKTFLFSLWFTRQDRAG